MQSNDAIEVVAPLGGGISEVALFPDAAAVPAGTAVSTRPIQLQHSSLTESECRGLCREESYI